ncbi:MAG TPA: hypothetical protein ENN84_09375, partial [Candidatus Marinimicrobia bacterium]|nr:hypothetical protein [Candidatus Neomarinimicrobiota bacterium]
MKKILLLITLLTMPLLGYTIESATDYSNYFSDGKSYGQSFTSLNAGQISKMKVGAANSPAGPFTVDFFQGEYAAGSTPIASITFTFDGSNTYKEYEVNPPIAISANTVYSFRLSEGIANVFYSAGKYSGGKVCIDGDWSNLNYQNQDLNFVITVAEVTPEAPTLSTVQPSAVSYTTVQSGGE